MVFFVKLKLKFIL